LYEASGAYFLEMYMVYPQRNFLMISINISLLVTLKLEDKCGFHFSLMLLLSEERIISKSLKFKKREAICFIVTGHKKSEIGAITSGIILKHICISIFKLV